MATLSPQKRPQLCPPARRSRREPARTGRRWIRRAESWLLGCVLAVSTARQIQAQTAAPSEYQIKAAFLYNFARFVEWPSTAFADSMAPFTFGILGSDPFGRDIDQAVQGKIIAGRLARVERLHGTPALGQCQLLFVGASEADYVGMILAALQGVPILLVADMPDFARRGGHIQLFTENNKVRFEINVGSADRAGLKVGSKLLRLATAVFDAGH